MYVQVKIKENMTKNLIREEKTTNKISSNIFRGFEDGKIVTVDLLKSKS